MKTSFVWNRRHREEERRVGVWLLSIVLQNATIHNIISFHIKILPIYQLNYSNFVDCIILYCIVFYYFVTKHTGDFVYSIICFIPFFSFLIIPLSHILCLHLNFGYEFGLWFWFQFDSIHIGVAVDDDDDDDVDSTRCVCVVWLFSATHRSLQSEWPSFAWSTHINALVNSMGREKGKSVHKIAYSSFVAADALARLISFRFSFMSLRQVGRDCH